jgi:hypothetical protein
MAVAGLAPWSGGDYGAEDGTIREVFCGWDVV